MPANYVLLERIELNASAASVTFANIPQSGYTDLKIVMSTRAADSANNWYATKIQFNTDTTASNYPYKVLYGFGSTVGSGSGNQYAGYIPSNARTANTFGNNEIYIPNYLSTTAKSFSTDTVTEGNGSSYEILGFWAGQWSGTAAINQVVLSPDTGSWAANSTFSLYGLAAVGTTPVIAPKASGGNRIDNDGTYWYHTFTSTGAFVPNQSLSCETLTVGAGGGSGADASGGAAGGGGAGGVVYTSSVGISVNSYTVTIGAGGAAGASSGLQGTSGANSSITGGSLSLTASVGGGGGGAGVTNMNGLTGGSGGGGGGRSGTGGTGGAATSGQGFAGGTGSNSSAAGAGGGGAGAVGGNGGSASGGVGTATYSAWGAATVTGQNVSGTYYYAGGGAGWVTGTGGSGGGGSQNVNGTANTGGGGGAYTGNGGSGIVIIRYPIA
jgi:hypothetical protein